MADTPIGNSNLLIAAATHAGDLKLVTGNTRTFERVPGWPVETGVAYQRHAKASA